MGIAIRFGGSGYRVMGKFSALPRAGVSLRRVAMGMVHLTGIVRESPLSAQEIETPMPCDARLFLSLRCDASFVQYVLVIG